MVLNYNGGDLTLRCLDHLLALEWPSDALEVVCVDNGSTDGSAERIEAEYPSVELRRNELNLGFPGNNIALTDLDGVDFVGLVNNDAFVEPGFLPPLVETLEAAPTIGAACPKLVLAPRFAEVGLATSTFTLGALDSRELGVMVRGVTVDGVDVSGDAHLGAGGWGRERDRDGDFEWTAHEAVLRVPVSGGGGRTPTVVLSLQAEGTKDVTLTTGTSRYVVAVGPRSTPVTIALATGTVDVVNNVGSVVFADGAGADRGWLEVDDGQYDEPVDVFAWCGGAVLLRPAYLADVGLFDQRFFLYYEDTDLSWRGQARGWRYRTAPEARVRHVHAASSGEGSELFAYYVERNRLLMLVKNAPWRLVGREVLRYVFVTGSYARRDLVAPVLRARRPRPGVVRRRLVSFGGFLRLLPVMSVERRRLRRRQRVSDRRLREWLTPR